MSGRPTGSNPRNTTRQPPRAGAEKVRKERAASQQDSTDNPYASISVNITEIGALHHDITDDDTVEVAVCENGILIQPKE